MAVGISLAVITQRLRLAFVLLVVPRLYALKLLGHQTVYDGDHALASQRIEHPQFLECHFPNLESLCFHVVIIPPIPVFVKLGVFSVLLIHFPCLVR